MIPLRNEQQKSYEKAKICYICRKKYEDKYIDNKKYCRVRDHCHYKDKYIDLAHSICNLIYSILKKELPVVFHKRSNYDYHFIIRELAKVFEGKFNCLGENTKKYKTISVPITN